MLKIEEVTDEDLLEELKRRKVAAAPQPLLSPNFNPHYEEIKRFVTAAIEDGQALDDDIREQIFESSRCRFHLLSLLCDHLLHLRVGRFCRHELNSVPIETDRQHGHEAKNRNSNPIP